MVGIMGEESFYNKNDSIGDFYVDDKAVLNQLKKEWRFKKMRGKSVYDDCYGPFGYVIEINKNGKSLERISIICPGWPCTICSKKPYRYEPGKILIFKDKLKPLFKGVKEIKDVNEAKEYYDKLLSDTNCVSTTISVGFGHRLIWNWEQRIEGEFSFYYPKRKSPFSEKDVHWNLMRYIDEELSLKYPSDYLEVDILNYNEQREGDSLSKNDTVFLCQMRCKKSMFEKFDFYQKASDWQPYSFFVKTYWKRKPD